MRGHRLVKAHFRKQWFPKEGVHKVVWIESHWVRTPKSTEQSQYPTEEERTQNG